MGFLIIYFLYGRNPSESEAENFDTYLMVDFDPSQNISTRGFSELGRKLQENEYLSYYNDDTGHSTIISNFGDTEYECTGSCYCEEYRRNTGVLTNGLFVIISAFSVITAVQMASDSFRMSCEKKFSDECDESKIVSEIDDCKETTFEEDIKERIYDCIGHCVYNRRIKSKHARKKVKKKFGSCKGLKLSMTVSVEQAGNSIDECNTLARSKFAKTHLTMFCRTESVISYFYEKATRTYQYVQEREAPACVSYIRKKSYKNIKCTLQRF